MWRLGSILAVTVLALTAALALDTHAPPRDAQIGQSFQVPYRLTDTNHFLVRVRINGKGPFNFLVDSGAPALFVPTETARKVGLKPARDDFWTPIDRLDIEGGARLANVNARVEDLYQLVGMNALGLPGVSIDGVLGFTILARFRLEIDLTRDRMTWTRLDYQPHDPPVPRRKPGRNDRAPVGMQALNVLGPLSKALAFLMGKQPEEQQHPRGFLGLEWSTPTPVEPGQVGLRITRVLAGSPAALAGLEVDDRVLRINGRAVANSKEARAALADVQPGDPVAFVVHRGSGSRDRELRLVLTAGKGL
jgi:hypothetical protein